MARRVMHACFIFSVVTLLFTVSKAEEERGANHTETSEERVLKCTLRTFPDQHGRWVTQVHLEREGHPNEGAVPRVTLSVEQNATKASEPPRIVARLTEASRLDDAIEELEGRRFSLRLLPPASWDTAARACLEGDESLAVPSPAAFDWLREALHRDYLSDAGEVTKLFVGISNSAPLSRSFKTVTGQEVRNGTEPLIASSLLCGVLHLNKNPYTLSFQDCGERLPFLCEDKKYANTEELNVGPWLTEPHPFEDYVDGYPAIGGYTFNADESASFQSFDEY